MNGLAALAFALLGIHVGAHRVLPIGYAPAWSPDGQRIAFVTRGDLWVADADGKHTGKLVSDADQPAWSPNGRRLAFERGGAVWTIRADGLDERRLAVGAHPAWSPDGRRLAFDRDGEVITVRWYGGNARAAGLGEDPAYGPRGQLAVVQDGEIVVRGNVVASGTEPAWSPTGKLAWVERQHHLRRRSPRARRAAARLETGRPRPRASPGLRPARADGPDDRGRTGPMAARIHLTRRQHRPRTVGARRGAQARPTTHDRHAARPAGERQGAHLRQRRSVPLHELTPASPLAPDALRQLRAAHARRAHTRPRPQERLLPGRPLGSRTWALAGTSPTLSR